MSGFYTIAFTHSHHVRPHVVLKVEVIGRDTYRTIISRHYTRDLAARRARALSRKEKRT